MRIAHVYEESDGIGGLHSLRLQAIQAQHEWNGRTDVSGFIILLTLGWF